MAWNKTVTPGLVAGFVGLLVAVGCTVTTSDHLGTGDGGLDEAGGATGSGGASSGDSGTGTGGKASTGGGTGTGGATADAGSNGCIKCLETKCATEWTDCKAEEACGGKDGSPPVAGEFVKTQECMINILVSDAGAGLFSASDLADCASSAAVDPAGIPSTASDALLACVHGTEGDAATEQPCTVDCFGDIVPFQ